mgnify:CR=1 FL=1
MTNFNNDFASKARDEFETAGAKDSQVDGLKKELNSDANKLIGVAFFAVVAKEMDLDKPKFTGRKKAAGEFRDVAASFGLGEANAKLTCETAIKMTRHAAFGNAIEAAVKHGNVGNFAQEIGGIFAAEGITTASKLRKLLNPEAAVPAVDEVVFHAFKKVGVKKNDLKVTKAAICTGTIADDEALQLLLDAAARIDPRVKEVATTLVPALNSGDVEIEVDEAA